MLADAAYVRPDGVMVAANKAGFPWILNPINLTELNEAQNGYAWTGLSSSCSGWTVGSDGVGTFGFSWVTNGSWFNFSDTSCGSPYNLYCFQQ